MSKKSKSVEGKRKADGEKANTAGNVTALEISSSEDELLTMSEPIDPLNLFGADESLDSDDDRMLEMFEK